MVECRRTTVHELGDLVVLIRLAASIRLLIGGQIFNASGSVPIPETQLSRLAYVSSSGFIFGTVESSRVLKQQDGCC
jgi:hypothetical protein